MTRLLIHAGLSAALPFRSRILGEGPATWTSPRSGASGRTIATRPPAVEALDRGPRRGAGPERLDDRTARPPHLHHYGPPGWDGETTKRSDRAPGNGSRDLYRRMLVELGLTPSSRSRLKTTAKPARDAPAEFLAR